MDWIYLYIIKNKKRKLMILNKLKYDIIMLNKGEYLWKEMNISKTFESKLK